MTTINSPDDFLRALDANPSWREAVRTRILGEELLQLPVKFDAFAQEQGKRLENVENLVQEQSSRLENVENLVQEQNTRTTNIEVRMDRIEGDTGTLKGDFARTRAIQDAQGVASDMGLAFVRTLSATDLSDMSGNALPRDIGRSFRNADLVIEATDGGGTHYIAMEISFTADRRDCDWAIRNAGLITRFTGKTGAGRHRQRQERPGHNGGGGVQSGVLAPAGRPDAEPRVTPKNHSGAPPKPAKSPQYRLENRK